jgi:hypothetical protein
MSLKLFDLFRRLTTSDITNGYGSGYDQVRIRLVLKRKDNDLPAATARFDLCRIMRLLVSHTSQWAFILHTYIIRISPASSRHDSGVSKGNKVFTKWEDEVMQWLLLVTDSQLFCFVVSVSSHVRRWLRLTVAPHHRLPMRIWIQNLDLGSTDSTASLTPCIRSSYSMKELVYISISAGESTSEILRCKLSKAIMESNPSEQILFITYQSDGHSWISVWVLCHCIHKIYQINEWLRQWWQLESLFQLRTGWAWTWCSSTTSFDWLFVRSPENPEPGRIVPLSVMIVFQVFAWRRKAMFSQQ